MWKDWNRWRQMDVSGPCTAAPVVATVPDCIRVTIVQPDIFGLASSQRTWLNMHTCAHRNTHLHTHTQRCSVDPLFQRAFVSSLIGSWAPPGPPPLSLSTYFLGIPLNFSWHTALLFLHSLQVCRSNLWITFTIAVSAQSVAFGLTSY